LDLNNKYIANNTKKVIVFDNFGNFLYEYVHREIEKGNITHPITDENLLPKIFDGSVFKDSNSEIENNFYDYYKISQFFKNKKINLKKK
jgi:hypothetical protein